MTLDDLTPPDDAFSDEQQREVKQLNCEHRWYETIDSVSACAECGIEEYEWRLLNQ